MRTHGRPKFTYPPRGDGAWRQGGSMPTHGRPKFEIPLGETARGAKGAT